MNSILFSQSFSLRCKVLGHGGRQSTGICNIWNKFNYGDILKFRQEIIAEVYEDIMCPCRILNTSTCGENIDEMKLTTWGYSVLKHLECNRVGVVRRWSKAPQRILIKGLGGWRYLYHCQFHAYCCLLISKDDVSSIMAFVNVLRIVSMQANTYLQTLINHHPFVYQYTLRDRFLIPNLIKSNTLSWLNFVEWYRRLQNWGSCWI